MGKRRACVRFVGGPASDPTCNRSLVTVTSGHDEISLRQAKKSTITVFSWALRETNSDFRWFTTCSCLIAHISVRRSWCCLRVQLVMACDHNNPWKSYVVGTIFRSLFRFWWVTTVHVSSIGNVLYKWCHHAHVRIALFLSIIATVAVIYWVHATSMMPSMMPTTALLITHHH